MVFEIVLRQPVWSRECAIAFLAAQHLIMNQKYVMAKQLMSIKQFITFVTIETFGMSHLMSLQMLSRIDSFPTYQAVERFSRVFSVQYHVSHQVRLTEKALVALIACEWSFSQVGALVLFEKRRSQVALSTLKTRIPKGTHQQFSRCY